MEKKEFTISVFTENNVGILHRITVIFTRRGINIQNITVSQSEIRGVSRFVMVVTEEEEKVIKVVKQIEKQIEVLRAFYNSTEEIVYQEIALYKVPTVSSDPSVSLEQILRENHARILTLDKDFIVIEKTGHKEETRKLFDELEPYGIHEFIRSGRVAISKSPKKFSDYLKVPELGTRISDEEVRQLAEKIN